MPPVSYLLILIILRCTPSLTKYDRNNFGGNPSLDSCGQSPDRENDLGRSHSNTFSRIRAPIQPLQNKVQRLLWMLVGLNQLLQFYSRHDLILFPIYLMPGDMFLGNAHTVNVAYCSIYVYVYRCGRTTTWINGRPHMIPTLPQPIVIQLYFPEVKSPLASKSQSGSHILNG